MNTKQKILSRLGAWMGVRRAVRSGTQPVPSAFVRAVASVTLAAFVYSFVLYQSILGIEILVKEQNAAAELQNRLDQFVLPYQFGRIMGGGYTGKDKLVVYVQDLHCHPEVQRNIYQIINLFDSRFGVKRIMVEGAPEGKIDTSILGSIPEENIKKKTLESLLNKGLISGAEFYSVVNKQDKLYGLEKWDTYVKNLECMQKLIGRKEENKAVGDRLEAQLSGLKNRYLSGKVRRLSNYLQPKDPRKRGTEKRYLKLEELGQRVGEDINEYPNLKRYVDMIQLNREIRFKRLPSELREFIRELQSVVPFGVYQALAEKLEKENKEEEYYFGLSEVAKTYSPKLGERYPNVGRFLEYIRLNYTINPIFLLNEDAAFCDRILKKYAERPVDKEILLLVRMGAACRNLVDLKVTPEEYGYFKENAATFRVLLQKYLPYEDTRDVLALLDDEDISSFYETNVCRNDIFVKNIVAAVEPSRGDSEAGMATTLDGYKPVVEHLSDFKDIEVVVTGGFHTEIAKVLGTKNISYLAVTPNATREFNDSIYDQVITGKLDLRAITTSALAPELLNLLGISYRSDRDAIRQIGAQNLEAIVSVMLLQAQDENYPLTSVNSIIGKWAKDAGLVDKLKDLNIKYAGNSWEITFDENGRARVLEVSIAKDGKTLQTRIRGGETESAGETARMTRTEASFKKDFGPFGSYKAMLAAIPRRISASLRALDLNAADRQTAENLLALERQIFESMGMLDADYHNHAHNLAVTFAGLRLLRAKAKETRAVSELDVKIAFLSGLLHDFDLRPAGTSASVDRTIQQLEAILGNHTAAIEDMKKAGISGKQIEGLRTLIYNFLGRDFSEGWNELKAAIRKTDYMPSPSRSVSDDKERMENVEVLKLGAGLRQAAGDYAAGRITQVDAEAAAQLVRNKLAEGLPFMKQKFLSIELQYWEALKQVNPERLAVTHDISLNTQVSDLAGYYLFAEPDLVEGTVVPGLFREMSSNKQLSGAELQSQTERFVADNYNLYFRDEFVEDPYFGGIRSSILERVGRFDKAYRKNFISVIGRFADRSAAAKAHWDMHTTSVKEYLKLNEESLGASLATAPNVTSVFYRFYQSLRDRDVEPETPEEWVKYALGRLGDPLKGAPIWEPFLIAAISAVIDFALPGLGKAFISLATGAIFSLLHPDLYDKGLPFGQRLTKFAVRTMMGTVYAAPLTMQVTSMVDAMSAILLSSGAHALYNYFALQVGLPVTSIAESRWSAWEARKAQQEQRRPELKKAMLWLNILVHWGLYAQGIPSDEAGATLSTSAFQPNPLDTPAKRQQLDLESRIRETKGYSASAVRNNWKKETEELSKLYRALDTAIKYSDYSYTQADDSLFSVKREYIGYEIQSYFIRYAAQSARDIGDISPAIVALMRFMNAMNRLDVLQENAVQSSFIEIATSEELLNSTNPEDIRALQQAWKNSAFILPFAAATKKQGFEQVSPRKGAADAAIVDALSRIKARLTAAAGKIRAETMLLAGEQARYDRLIALVGHCDTVLQSLGQGRSSAQRTTLTTPATTQRFFELHPAWKSFSDKGGWRQSFVAAWIALFFAPRAEMNQVAAALASYATDKKAWNEFLQSHQNKTPEELSQREKGLLFIRSVVNSFPFAQRLANGIAHFAYNAFALITGRAFLTASSGTFYDVQDSELMFPRVSTVKVEQGIIQAVINAAVYQKDNFAVLFGDRAGVVIEAIKELRSAPAAARAGLVSTISSEFLYATCKARGMDLTNDRIREALLERLTGSINDGSLSIRFSDMKEQMSQSSQDGRIEINSAFADDLRLLVVLAGRELERMTGRGKDISESLQIDRNDMLALSQFLKNRNDVVSVIEKVKAADPKSRMITILDKVGVGSAIQSTLNQLQDVNHLGGKGIERRFDANYVENIQNQLMFFSLLNDIEQYKISAAPTEGFYFITVEGRHYLMAGRPMNRSDIYATMRLTGGRGGWVVAQEKDFSEPIQNSLINGSLALTATTSDRILLGLSDQSYFVRKLNTLEEVIAVMRSGAINPAHVTIKDPSLSLKVGAGLRNAGKDKGTDGDADSDKDRGPGTTGVTGRTRDTGTVGSGVGARDSGSGRDKDKGARERNDYTITAAGKRISGPTLEQRLSGLFAEVIVGKGVTDEGIRDIVKKISTFELIKAIAAKDASGIVSWLVHVNLTLVNRVKILKGLIADPEAGAVLAAMENLDEYVHGEFVKKEFEEEWAKRRKDKSFNFDETGLRQEVAQRVRSVMDRVLYDDKGGYTVAHAGKGIGISFRDASGVEVVQMGLPLNGNPEVEKSLAALRSISMEDRIRESLAAFFAQSADKGLAEHLVREFEKQLKSVFVRDAALKNAAFLTVQSNADGHYEVLLDMHQLHSQNEYAVAVFHELMETVLHELPGTFDTYRKKAHSISLILQEMVFGDTLELHLRGKSVSEWERIIENTAAEEESIRQAINVQRERSHVAGSVMEKTAELYVYSLLRDNEFVTGENEARQLAARAAKNPALLRELAQTLGKKIDALDQKDIKTIRKREGVKKLDDLAVTLQRVSLAGTLTTPDTVRRFFELHPGWKAFSDRGGWRESIAMAWIAVTFAPRFEANQVAAAIASYATDKAAWNDFLRSHENKTPEELTQREKGLLFIRSAVNSLPFAARIANIAAHTAYNFFAVITGQAFLAVNRYTREYEALMREKEKVLAELRKAGSKTKFVLEYERIKKAGGRGTQEGERVFRNSELSMKEALTHEIMVWIPILAYANFDLTGLPAGPGQAFNPDSFIPASERNALSDSIKSRTRGLDAGGSSEAMIISLETLFQEMSKLDMRILPSVFKRLEKAFTENDNSYLAYEVGNYFKHYAKGIAKRSDILPRAYVLLNVLNALNRLQEQGTTNSFIELATNKAIVNGYPEAISLLWKNCDPLVTLVPHTASKKQREDATGRPQLVDKAQKARLIATIQGIKKRFGSDTRIAGHCDVVLLELGVPQTAPRGGIMPFMEKFFTQTLNITQEAYAAKYAWWAENLLSMLAGALASTLSFAFTGSVDIAALVFGIGTFAAFMAGHYSAVPENQLRALKIGSLSIGAGTVAGALAFGATMLFGLPAAIVALVSVPVFLVAFFASHYAMNRIPARENVAFATLSRYITGQGRTDEIRQLVIGDIHGEYDTLIKLLRDAEYIDDNLNWTAGNRTLISVGDVLDRGDEAQARRAYDLLEKLQDQARAAGGNVVRLIGNHERDYINEAYRKDTVNAGLMGMYLDLKPEEELILQENGNVDLADVDNFNFERADAWRDRLRKDVLAGKLVAAHQVGDRLVVHAGNTPEMSPGLSLEAVVRRYNNALVAAVRQNDYSDPMFGRDGIMEAGVAKAASIVFKQIVGHTVGTAINPGADIINVDIGMNKRFYNGGEDALVVTAAADAGAHAAPALEQLRLRAAKESYAKPLIVMIGRPGSGKGAIGGEVSQRLNVPMVSVGDVVRSLRQADPEIVKQPGFGERIVAESIARMSDPRIANGLILDCNPFTVEENAKLLLNLANMTGLSIVVVNIDADEAVCRERIVTRGRSEDLRELDASAKEPGIETKIDLRMRDFGEKTASVLETYRESGIAFARVENGAGAALSEKSDEIMRSLEGFRNSAATRSLAADIVRTKQITVDGFRFTYEAVDFGPGETGFEITAYGENGQLAGQIVAHADYIETAESGFALATRPVFARRGVGTALLAVAMGISRNNGSLEFKVNKAVESAVGFYDSINVPVLERRSAAEETALGQRNYTYYTYDISQSLPEVRISRESPVAPAANVPGAVQTGTARDSIGVALSSALKPGKAMADVSVNAALGSEWASKNMQQVRGMSGLIIDMPGTAAREKARARAALGLRTATIGLLTGDDIIHDRNLYAMKTLNVTIANAQGEPVPVAVNVGVPRSHNKGEVLELLIEPASGSNVQNPRAAAFVARVRDALAAGNTADGAVMQFFSGTVLALTREMSDTNQGSVFGTLLKRSGLGALWLVETNGDVNFMDAMNFQIENTGAGRDVVWGRWDVAETGIEEYMKGLAGEYGMKREMRGQVRREKTPGREATSTKQVFVLDTVLSLFAGNISGLRRFAQRSGSNILSAGLRNPLVDGAARTFADMAGIDVTAIDWAAIAEGLPKAARSEVLDMLGRLPQFEGTITRSAAESLRNELLRVAEKCYDAEYGSPQALSRDLSGAEQELVAVYARERLMSEMGVSPEEFAAKRSLFAKQEALHAYIEMKGLRQIKEAAAGMKLDGTDFAIDLGRLESFDAQMMSGILLFLQIVPGVRADITGMDNALASDFLASLRNEVDSLRERGMEPEVMLKTSPDLAGNVQRNRFIYDESITDETTIQRAARNGSYLEVSLMEQLEGKTPDQVKTLIESVLKSNAAGVVLRLGGINREGTIVRVQNVDTEGFGFLKLLDIMENLLSAREVMTVEAQFETGWYIAGEIQRVSRKLLVEGMRSKALQEIEDSMESGKDIDALLNLIKSVAPEALRQRIENLKGRTGEERRIYLSSIRGMLYGIIGKTLLAQSGVKIEDPAAQKAVTITMVDLFREQATYAEQGDLKFTGEIDSLGELMRMLGAADRAALAEDVAKNVLKDTLGWLKFADALYKSGDAYLMKTWLPAVKANVGSYSQQESANLSYWVNFEAVMASAMKERETLALDDFKQKLSTLESSRIVLLLSLSAGDIFRAGDFGRLFGDNVLNIVRKAIAEQQDQSDPLVLLAKRVLYKLDTGVTVAQVNAERARIAGQVNAAAADTKRKSPRTIAVAFSMLFEIDRILKDKETLKDIVKKGFNVTAPSTIRLVLTAS